MRNPPALLLIALLLAPTLAAQSPAYRLFFDDAVPPVRFGVDEIKVELARLRATASSETIAAFRAAPNAISITITATQHDATRLCRQLGLPAPVFERSQTYRLRRIARANTTSYLVLAADASGAMYGALDLAEALRLGTFATLADCDRAPFVEHRGIKFNLPLDMRSPTYSDRNDASQDNIPVMWDLDFWKEMLDQMARTRYNSISLWSLHPFPSLVKVPEFPDVALDDVWRQTSPAGRNIFNNKSNDTPVSTAGDYEVVRRISIDEKIRFWRAVMQYGRDRGIAFHLYTWNIFTHGAEPKYGINHQQNNDTTIAYFRASLRETLLTYPLLAGLGVTAGERMQNLNGDYSNENWLWKTYGEGVRDALRLQPGRPFRLTHRFHMASQKEILDAWKDFPGDFDFSFKYLYAHMLSDTKSVFIQPALQQIAPGRKMWVELRNDDVYSFRWGDPDFAREFIRNLPPADKLAGFNMGPDGYCWGREFMSTEPEQPRELVIKKQWYNFMLWGRLSFDPTLPNSHFEQTLAARFPGIPAATLFVASQEASRIFPEITRFFWGDIDVRWLPETCMKSGQFYTIRDFILQVTMPGTDNVNIMLWRDQIVAGQKVQGKTPLQVATALQGYADRTLALVAQLRALRSPSKELRLTLGDYEAFAHLGHYYAEKIRGAADIALYDATRNRAEQTSAVQHLEAALEHWRKYAAIYTEQYVQPLRYGRTGLVDIPGKLMNDVAADIAMARNWQAGTIKGPLVGRKESNFKP